VLSPAPDISGEAGSTIGWGYSILNETGAWLEVFDFFPDSAFANATPDASLFGFPILAPLASHTVAYDPAALLGLYQLTWDPGAPAGFTNSGQFVVSANFWDVDPLGEVLPAREMPRPPRTASR
jgi:hypothetical protein